MINISIVSAALNECPQILNTISKWIYFLKSHNEIENWEIIICDDKSEISQYEELKAAFQHEEGVIILRNEVNEGPGYSFHRTINLAKYDWTLIVDSDGQFPIDNLQNIIQNINYDLIDAILTFRDKKIDNIFNQFGQYVSNIFCNYIFKTKLKDFSCAFKLVRTAILQQIIFEARYMNYSIDHTAKLIDLDIKYFELGVQCADSPIKKRTYKQQLKRAIDRISFIFYLFIRERLIKKRIIFRPKLIDLFPQNRTDLN
jgi:dolichol-phosphate mannosyltransferase